MATHQYHKLQQGSYPNLKGGSNWVWIRVDFGLQPGAATDTYNLMEVKNHWIFKSGFTRVSTAETTATGTFDIQVVGANDIDAAIDITSATDTWLRTDTLDDDAPIATTADGYLTGTLNTAAAVNGILDILLEIVICPVDVDAAHDSLGS